MRKRTKQVLPCDEFGHEWRHTTSPGWYQCRRLLSNDRYCGLVAHCPGCVGLVLACLTVQFCTVHRQCRVEDFPVVSHGCVLNASVGEEVNQQLLW